MSRGKKRSSWFGTACVAVALTCATACWNKENERWEAAQESAERRVEQKAKGEVPKAVEGGALNKFFPADGAAGLRRTFDQEKEGFVQAK